MQNTNRKQLWADPAVEHDFTTFDTFATAVRAQADQTERRAFSPADARKIRVAGDGGRLLVVGPNGGALPLTSWAAGQLATKAGAPWNAYVRSLPASAVESYLNPGLASADWASGASVIATVDADEGGPVVRGINTAEYGVIRSTVIVDAIEAAFNRGWAQAPNSVNTKRPTFTLSAERADATLIDHKGLGVFQRTLQFRNGDVGNIPASVLHALMEMICTNGAMTMRESSNLKRRHIGANAERDFMYAVRSTLSQVPDMSDELAVIAKARQTELAPPDATDEQIVKATLRIIGSGIVSESTLQLARTAAVSRRYTQNVEPNTIWGQASGMTWISQGRSRGEQATIDKAAGRLVQSVRVGMSH